MIVVLVVGGWRWRGGGGGKAVQVRAVVWGSWL